MFNQSNYVIYAIDADGDVRKAATCRSSKEVYVTLDRLAAESQCLPDGGYGARAVRLDVIEEEGLSSNGRPLERQWIRFYL